MLNIIDIENQFSKQKINKAKKLIVRDLDEESKNKYVCYVDENEESYDACISIDDKLEVTDYSCDCKAKTFCGHLLALALHVSEIKNTKKTKKTKDKKASEAEVAMENLNSETLKNWLLQFFKKNKEVELQFLLEFGEKKNDFSDDEIRKIIDKSIESVIGKKINISASEVKKVVDILTKSLEPIDEFIWKNIESNISLDTYNLICEHLQNFQMKVYTTSRRIDSFLEKLRLKFAINFNEIKNHENWEKLAQKYWDLYLKGDGIISYSLYALLLDIYHNSNKVQKNFIAKIIRDEIYVWINNDVHLRTEMREDLLDIMIENEMFLSVKSYFPIAHYENSYNLKILNELMKSDKAEVEKWCNFIIQRNSAEKYNYPYYEILEKLYIENKDLAKIALIKKLKFQGNPTIEDYIFIESNEVDKAEFKKFRTKILGNLRKSFGQYPQNAEVYFEILEHEKKLSKND